MHILFVFQRIISLVLKKKVAFLIDKKLAVVIIHRNKK